MKNLYKLSFIFLASIAAVSCEKEEGSSKSLLMKIEAINSDLLVKSEVSTSPNLTWDTCLMTVSKIEFKAEMDDKENSGVSFEVEYEWKGPKEIDLFGSNSLIGGIQLMPGIYEEIKFEVESKKEDSDNSPVFHLSGKYKRATGETIPVIISINEDFKIEVETEDVQINTINEYTSLIQLDLSILMTDILQSEFESATVTNGKIVVSSSSNIQLYSKIKENLSDCDEFKLEKKK